MRFSFLSCLAGLFIFHSVFFATDANAQGCAGNLGGGLTGGVISFQNGQACVNIDNANPAAPASGAIIRVTVNNVQPGDLVEARINWNDGTGFTPWFALIDLDGAGPGLFHEVNSPKHFFPGTNTNCEYVPITEMRVNGVTCSPNWGTPPVFFRWNREDTPNSASSTILVSETLSSNVIYEVCAGASTTVTFTDRSNFNCNTNPGDVTIASNLNDRRRWRQFVYGGAGALNNITGGVTVGGTPVPVGTGLTGVVVTPAITIGAPAGSAGGVDQPFLAAAYVNPPTPIQTLSIIVPATAQIGEEFVITTRYWNTCNRYDFDQLPVENNAARIRVVGQPAAPTTAAVAQVCSGTTRAAMPTFAITTPLAGQTVRWYANVNGASPTVPGTVGALITSTVSGGGGAASIPFSTAFTGPGGTVMPSNNYIVWATYIGASGSINCESLPRAVTRSVRTNLSLTAQTITPAINGNLCPSTTLHTYTLSMPADPNPQPVGGNTEYVWTVPAGWTITAGQQTNSITVSLNATPSAGNVSVVWQYLAAPGPTNPPSCTSAALNLAVAPLATTTAANPTGTNTICQDASTTFSSVITGSATTMRWQIDADGAGPGVFVDIPTAGGDPYTNETTVNLGINTTGTGTTLNGARYRLVVTGTCGVANSNFRTLTVQPKANITVQPLGPPNICINGTKVFTVTAAGQAPLTFQWQVDADGPGPGVFVNVPSVGGDPYSGETTASLTINTTGTGSTLDGTVYQVIVNSGTCPTSVTSNQVILTIQGPTVSILPASPADVCADANLQLTASEVFTNGSFGSRAWTGTYDENFGAAPALIVLNNAQLDALLTDGVGGSRRTALNPIFNSAGLGPSKVGAYVFTLTTIDDNGCPNSATITVNVTEVVSTILHGPTAPGATIPGNASVCSGLDLFLDGNPSGGSGTYTTHTWTIQSQPGGAVGSLSATNIRNPVFNYTTPGVYELSYLVVDDGGCDYDTDLNAGNITITVDPLPTANNQNPPVICADAGSGTTATVNLTLQQPAINGGGGIIYTWFENYNPGTKVFSNLIATPASYAVSNAVPVFARVQDPVGCVNAATVTYTVEETPVLQLAQAKTICSGSSVDYEILLNPANSPAGTILTWPDPDGGGGPASAGNIAADPGGTLHITDVLTNFTGANTTVTYVVTPTSAAGCAGTPRNVVITVNPAPMITPGQIKTICSGEAVNHPITLTPAGLPAGTLFSWADPDGPGPANARAFPGTTAQIGDVLTNTTGADITVTYQVTPRGPGGALGTCTGATEDIVITVRPAPVIVAGQTKTICSGDPVNKEIFLNPANLPLGTVFNWPIPTMSAGPVQGTAGVNVAMGVAGTNHITESLINTTGNPITATYFVTPSAPAGVCSGVTQTVVITINPEPVIPAGQSKAICSGEAVNLEILLSPANLPAGTVFNWAPPTMSVGGPQGTNGLNVAMGAPGTLHITDVLTNTTGAPITATYSITPTGGTGCTGVQEDVVITINPLPVPNPIGGPGTVCVNPTNIILYQVTPNAGSTYTWTIPPQFTVFGGGGTNSTNFFVLLSFPVVDAGSQISVVETNVFGCVGPANNLNIIVAGAPGALAINGPTAVCKNQTGVNFSVPIGIFNPTSTYNWSAVGATIVSASSGVGLQTITVDFGLLPSADITLNEVSASGCSGTPVTLVVSAADRPVMTSSATNTICSGNTPSLVFTTSALIPSTFNWTVINITGGITGTLVGNVGTGNLSEVLTNISGFSGTVTYRVTPVAIAAPNCTGAPQDVVVTVNPEPVLVTPQTKTICSGTSTSYEILLSPLTFPVGTSFTWPVPVMSDASPQGSASAGSVPGGPAGTIHINDVLNNTSNADITATYTITPTSGNGCPGTPRTVVITVNPQPVVSTTLDLTRCSDIATGLTLSVAGTSVGAANYNITNRVIAGGLVAAGSNAFVPNTGVAANYLANDMFTNTSAAQLTITYTVVGVSAAGCVGSPQVITVTIDPEPVVSATLNATLCSDLPIALTLNTNGTSVAAANYNITGVTIAPGLTPGGANVAVPAAGVAANYLANDTYTNTGASQLTVVYSVVPVSAAGCLGNARNITMTIDPEPVISPALNASVCSDVVTGLTLATNGVSVAATSYNVTATTIAPGLVPAGTNAAVPTMGVTSAFLAADRFTNPGAVALPVTYTVEGVSAAGCVSNPLIITININPEPVLSNALNATVCSDIATGLMLNTNGASVAAATYNITARTIQPGLTPGGSNALVTATGVAANYLANDAFTNTGSTPLAVTYTVVPVSAAGCEGDPVIVTITVDPEPVVATTLDAFACSDVAIGLTLNTNGSSVAALNYNITARNIAGGLVAAGANAVVPAFGVAVNYLAADVFTNTGPAPLTVTYTVVGVSAAGCAGDPRVITMIIGPEPVVSGTLNTSVCSDLATGLVLNTNGISVGAFNYDITSSTIAPGLVPAGTNAVVPAVGVATNYLANDRFTNTGNAPLVVSYTVVPLSAAGCVGNPQVITVTINPEPVVSNALDLTQCSNVAIGLVLGTNGTSEPAINYNITSMTVSAGLVPAGGNVAVPAAGVAANYLSNHTFANSTSLSLTVLYTVVPVSAVGCLGDPKVITVTVDAGPIVANNLDATVCSDIPLGLVLNVDGASAPAANYNITARTIAGGLVAGGANALVPSNGVAANFLAGDTYTNTGTLPLDVTYTVVGVGVSGCLGTPRVITVTINPEPVMSNALNATLCSDVPIGLTLATNGTSVAALDYDVTARSIDAGLVAAGANAVVPASGVGSGYLSTDRFTNTGAIPLTVSYTVTARSAAGCTGNPQLITMTINPEPVLSPTLNGTVCSDLPTGLVLNTNGTSVGATNYNITGVTIAAGLSAAVGNAVVPANGVGVNYLAGDIFTNTGALALTVVYTIVPVTAGCLGDPVLVTRTIDPEPVVSATLDATICSDLATGLTLNTNGSSVAAALYNITASTVAPGLVAGGANAAVPSFGVAANFLAADVFSNTTSAALSVTYTVIPVSGAGCVGNSRLITLTINPEPVVSTLLNTTVCSDLVTGLVLNTNGTSAVAASYNITASTIDAGLVAAGTNVPVPVIGVAANYLAADRFTNPGAVPLQVTYTVVAISGAGCSGDPQVITVTINPEPIVSSLLDLTQCSDVPIGLILNTDATSVGAANYNITARSVAAGLTIGASNAVITANGVAANYLAADVYTNTGAVPLNVTYTVVPVSVAGCTGDPKVITVIINPEPVVLPTLNATVCSDLVIGLTLNTNGISVAADNYNITAQSIAAGLIPAGGNVAVPAVGVANNYLTNDVFTNPTGAALTVTYTVVPVSAAGCLGDPRVITMTINPEPVVSPALDASRCSDAAIGLTLATDGISVAAANYNITARTIDPSLVPAGTNVIVPAVGAAANYLLNDRYTNTGAVPLLVTYTVVPVSAAGCFGDPVIITITIDPEPVVANGLDAAVCSDLPIALTLNTNGTSVAAGTYNVTGRTVAGGLLAGGGNAIVPAMGVADNYLINDVFTNTTSAALSVTYTVVPVSGAGCLGDPKVITFTINPEPVVASGLDAARCSDVVTGLTLSTTGTSAAAANYNITSIVIAPGLIAAGGNAAVPAVGVPPIYLANDVFTNPTLVPLTVVYTVVPVTVAGCLGDPLAITITIGAEPVGADDVKTICSDAAVTYNLQTNVNTLGNGFSSNFIWVAAPNASVTGESTVAQAGPIITDVLNNLTNADQFVVYTVTPTGTNGCAGNPFTITVTVQPEPLGMNDVANINSDIILNYDLQNNVNTIGNNLPSNFSWVASINSNVGGESTTPQAGPLITDVLNNVTNANQMVTYTVIPTGTNGCTGNPFIITVTVLPEPVGFNDIVSVNSDVNINYNLQNNVNSGGNAVPANFIWVAADNPLVTGESLAPTATGTITDVINNVTGVDQIVVYTVIPTGTNGVLGDPFTITVTIRSEPLGANDAATVCSDVSAAYDLQNNLNTLGNGQAATFSWFAGANPNVTGESTVPQAGAFINDLLNNVTNADEVIVYTVTPTGTNGAPGNTFQISITVQPEPVVATTLNETQCSGVAYGKLLNTNGISIGAVSYDVTVVSKDAGITGGRPLGLIGGGGSADNVLMTDAYTNTTATPLKVIYSVVPNGTNGCIGNARLVEFTINPEPVLSNPGFPAVCSSNTSGNSIVNIILGTNGISVGAASYELMQIQYSDGGPFGVALPPSFTAAGGNAVVGAVGSIDLVRNDRYTNTSVNPVTVRYTVRGTSSTGCVGASLDYDVVVNPEPNLDPLLNPTPVCSGVASNVTLGVAAGSVAAATYNINSILFPGLTAGGANAGIGNGKLANAIFNDVYVNTTNGVLTAIYQIAPVSAAGCVGPEGTVTLTINPSPDLANNLNRIVCTNAASGIIFSTTASSVAAGSYNLISVTPQAGLIPAGTNVAFPAMGVPANFVSADQFVNPTNGPLTVTYSVVPVSGAPCLGPQEDIILTIEPTVTAAPISLKPNVCSGSGNGTDLTDIELISPTNPTSGVITFNYTAVSSIGTQITGFVPALSGLAEGYKITDNLANTSNAPATVTYTITPVAASAAGGIGCAGVPAVIIVTVEPKPKLVATTLKTLCEDVATAISLTSPTTPSAGVIEFELITAVPTGGVTGASANGTVFANGGTLNDMLSNPTTTAQTVTYTMRPRINGGAGCVGDDVIIIVTVNPRPTVTPSAQAPICSGDVIDITLTTDVVATVSTWTVTADPSITGESAGAGDRIFQILFNSSNVVQNVTYNVTPQSAGCAGVTVPVVVQVNPKAVVLGVPTQTIVCHGSTLIIPLTSNVAAATFAWTVDDPSGLGVPATGSGNVINQPMVNTLGFQATLTYTITPTGPGPGAGCVGDSKIMIVTVSPEITASWLNTPSPDFICLGSTEYLVLNIGGRAPFNFTYNAGGPGIIKNNQPPVAVLPEVPLATTTYTVTSITDGLGCTTAFNVPFLVNVGDTDPNYSIITPVATCSPNVTQFQYNQVAGTIYTWRFGDSPDSIYTATTSVPNMVIRHTYTNLSPSSTLNYPVTMQTELPAPFPGCFKTTPAKTVTIYPNVITNVAPNNSSICSGETIAFMNSSVGTTYRTWSYRVQGQIPETAMGSTFNMSFMFTNTTAANPIVYEVIFRSGNANCAAPDVIMPIDVYRSSTAGFTEGVVPPFINGESLVPFTNTSTIIDGGAFTYEWVFGADAQPANLSSTTPGTVRYVSPGPKEITLTVTNTAAPLCRTTFTRTINIVLPPLIAKFDVNPKESCFPAVIQVDTNPAVTEITGDIIEWTVVDQNNRVVSTSSGVFPEFNIPAEGEYTVKLRTSSSQTGQTTTAPDVDIVVYGKPFASFDARPDVVFVPDTELTVFNFSSDPAEIEYVWDFGDGDILTSPPAPSNDLAVPLGTHSDRTKGTYDEPIHLYKVEGIYDLTMIVRFDHGNNVVCADTLTHQVQARQGGVTKVPNAFTPSTSGPSGGVSGNGSFNDVFLPIVKGADEYNLQIFDRWGNLIFESNSSQIGWDGYNQNGQLLPAGVYVYKLTVRLSDGQRSTQIGDVTMIR